MTGTKGIVSFESKNIENCTETPFRRAAFGCVCICIAFMFITSFSCCTLRFLCSGRSRVARARDPCVVILTD